MLQYMHLNKKSQSSFEFILVTGIVMVFLVLILTLIVDRTLDFEQTKTELFTKTILESIEKEIVLARTLPSGYQRTFTLPRDLEDREFNFSIIKGKELVVTTNDQFEYVSFLPQVVYGTVGPGENILMKRGNNIGLCYKEKEDFCLDTEKNTTNKKCYCYGIFPSDTNGTVQCKEDELWKTCEFNYKDSYNGIKTLCNAGSPANNNVSMTLKYVDTNEIKYSANSTTTDYYDDNLFEFELSPNVVIDRSGLWEIKYTCYPQDETLVSQFYVPFGYYQIEPLGITSNPPCHKADSDTNYTCEENEIFEIQYRITCMNGDCGNTTVWLDP